MTFSAVPPTPGVRLGRRRLIAAAPLPLLLSSCKWNESTSGASVDAGAPATDGDATLVEQAVAAISETHAAVSNGAGRKAARTQLLALHQAHLEQLDASLPVPSTDLPAPAGSRGWVAVRRRERKLQETLVGLAGAAESGALARTLASMGAGIAQLLAAHTIGAGDG